MLHGCYSTTGGFGLKYLEALCNSVSSPKADHKLRVLVYKDGKKRQICQNGRQDKLKACYSIQHVQYIASPISTQLWQDISRLRMTTWKWKTHYRLTIDDLRSTFLMKRDKNPGGKIAANIFSCLLLPRTRCVIYTVDWRATFPSAPALDCICLCC